MCGTSPHSQDALLVVTYCDLRAAYRVTQINHSRSHFQATTLTLTISLSIMTCSSNTTTTKARTFKSFVQTQLV